MKKLTKSLLFGVALGVGTAYFLQTSKGKKLTTKAKELLLSYQEDPESYNQLVKNKADEYKEVTLDKLNNYQSKYKNMNLNMDDIVNQVKEKKDNVKDIISKKADKLSGVTKKKQDKRSKAEVDDIIIDYLDDEE